MVIKLNEMSSGNDEGSVNVIIQEVTPGWLGIRPTGYSVYDSQDGYGYPIILEVYDGEVRLIVWADINSENPTHTISLEGARTDKSLPSS